MSTKHRYVSGWLNSSIVDFIGDLPKARTIDYALLTCLDSNTDVATILGQSKELNKALANERGVEVIGTGLFVPISALIEHRDKIFFGFDEVWFFPYAVVEPKPTGISIVGPSRIYPADLTKMDHWMTRNHGSLALGDGCGLNVIAKVNEVMGAPLTLSLSQPQIGEVQ